MICACREAHLGKAGALWSPGSRFRNLALHLSAADLKRKRCSTLLDLEPHASRLQVGNSVQSLPHAIPALQQSAPHLPAKSAAVSGEPAAALGRHASSTSADKAQPAVTGLSSSDLKGWLHQRLRPAAAASASTSTGMKHGQQPPAADQAPCMQPSNEHHCPLRQVEDVAEAAEVLSAANVAWQGGKLKRHKKVLSRMQPHATADPASSAEPALPDTLETPSAAEPVSSAPMRPAPRLPAAAAEHLPFKAHAAATAVGLSEQHPAPLLGSSQHPQLQEPKVASSDSTDSLVAFPSRHQEAGLQEAARDELSTDSNPSCIKALGHWKLTESRGAGALSFLKSAGSALKGAADPKDAYWSGVSDADIAHLKTFSG